MQVPEGKRHKRMLSKIVILVMTRRIQNRIVATLRVLVAVLTGKAILDKNPQNPSRRDTNRVWTGFLKSRHFDCKTFVRDRSSQVKVSYLYLCAKALRQYFNPSRWTIQFKQPFRVR